MKVIRDNRLYVQKRDLGLVFGKPFDTRFYINSTLDIEFVEITDDESKKKVIESSFIVDYDEYLKKSIGEITNKCSLVNSRLISITLHSRKVVDKDDLEKINFECKKLINLANELYYLVFLKEHKKTIEIPFDGRKF